MLIRDWIGQGGLCIDGGREQHREAQRQARETYYAELHAASRADADYTRWLVWFCGRFEAACKRSAALMHAAMDKARYWARHAAAGFDNNQRKVINRLLDAGPRGPHGGPAPGPRS